MNHHFSYAYGFFANSFLVALKSAPPATRQEGRMIAVPPSFVLNKIPFEHLKSVNGDESEMPTQCVLQHLSSKATFHTTFCGHLPADECPSLSAARCVLLFVITFDYLLS